MNYEKMQAETDVSAVEDQANPPAPDNINQIVDWINQCRNPEQILQILLALKPFLNQRDN